MFLDTRDLLWTCQGMKVADDKWWLEANVWYCKTNVGMKFLGRKWFLGTEKKLTEEICS
jgi:hypothetical protein